MSCQLNLRYFIILGTLITKSKNDALKLVTKSAHIRFSYDTPILTFQLAHTKPDVQIDLFYYIVGGSVLGPLNQSQLRIKCRLIYANLNRILMNLKRFLFLKSQQAVISTFISVVSDAVVKLAQPMAFQFLYEKMSDLNLKLHNLQNVLEIIKGKIKSDIVHGTMLEKQIHATLSYIKHVDLLAKPKSDGIEEKFNAFSIYFYGKVCLYQLCIDSCFVKGSFENIATEKLIFKCKTYKEQLLNDVIYVKNGSEFDIEISTVSNQYSLRFNASVSIFTKTVEANFEVSAIGVTYVVRNFSFSDFAKFDLKAHAINDAYAKWKTLNFKYKGVAVQNIFTTLFEEGLNKQLGELVEEAQAKMNFIDDQISDARFHKLEERRMNLTSQREHARLHLRVSQQQLKEALLLLARARTQFKSYQVNSYLRNYEQTLDKNVCILQDCPNICFNTRSCDVCQKSQTVNTQSLKCVNVEKKVRLTKEEEYETNCQEIIRVMETIYTGNCHGGEASNVAGALPDFGAGIGHTFGGPVGALIGGLSGAFVGQFFQTCENTWDKYHKKIMVNTPCKKIRLHTEEQIWQQSECGLYHQEILSRYGLPVECNCTNQCISTKDATCLHVNQVCLNKRKSYLESLLARAGVFNTTATGFMECEKNVTFYQNLHTAAVKQLQEVEREYSGFNTMYHQAITFRQNLQNEKLKLSHKNIEKCLMEKYLKNHTVKTKMMELKINSEDDVDLTLFLADGIYLKRNVTLDVALYNMEDNLVAAEASILNEIFCNSNSAAGYSSSTGALFAHTKYETDKNMMCNQVVSYYSFLNHSINSIRESVISALGNIKTREREINNIKIEIKKLTSYKDIKELRIITNKLQTKLLTLQKENAEITPALLVVEWIQKMDIFTREARLFDSFGFMDSVDKIFKRLIKLKHYSGDSPMKYRNLIFNMKTFYKHFFKNYKEVSEVRRLRLDVDVLQRLFIIAYRQSRFCSQYLAVSLNDIYGGGSLISYPVGHYISLYCSARSSNNIRYSWYKNQQLLPRKHGERLELVLKPEDAGAYRCKVDTFIASNITDEVIIEVTAKPSITEHPKDVDLIMSQEEGDIVFTCNVTGIPAPQVNWFYTSYSLKDTMLVASSTLLTLKRKDDPKKGFYYCKGTNSHGVAKSKFAKLNILKSCAALQVFRLTFDIPREEVTPILTKIFYSESARKAWSTSQTQKISLSVSHGMTGLSKVSFKLLDNIVNGDRLCKLADREILRVVSLAKTNMVQLLKNVLHTMSVKVDENSTIAEMRENLRSTLVLEPTESEFCPPGFTLHESQYKCGECYI